MDEQRHLFPEPSCEPFFKNRAGSNGSGSGPFMTFLPTQMDPIR